MMNKILITGASGLIGLRLTELLQSEGHEVRHFSRSEKKSSTPSFLWNPETNTIDRQAFENIDTIIHLAGAGVAEKRWSKKRKDEILSSRVQSTRLLVNALKEKNHSVKTIIAASAIGFYGFDEVEKILTEQDEPGKDFLAQVTQQWEHEVDQFQALHLRVVKIRIGIVLSQHGGALKEMAKPIRLGLGASLGSGQQYLSWIHIDDLCRFFIYAIKNQAIQGVYNGVTDWCTNAELTKTIAKNSHRPLWLPAIPPFVLKIILGEMADMVLKGNRISSEKMRSAGFSFQHTVLEEAVTNLLNEG